MQQLVYSERKGTFYTYNHEHTGETQDSLTTKRKKKIYMKSKNNKNETKVIKVNYIWLVRSAEVP
jgi:hypothetical protein